MRFFAVSVFPQMFAALSEYGISGRAIADGKAHLHCINPRDFATDNYRRVDDRPFGGGPGMVMMAEPLDRAIDFAQAQAAQSGASRCPVVYLSPQGEPLNEQKVQSLLRFEAMALLCGRYEGVDERLLQRRVDMELSVGDYVLSGGELPAMTLMDSLIRRLPSVMNDDRSAQEDSFVDGLLDCPHYTRPANWQGEKAPEVLFSGHHERIAKWRFLQQVERTKARRPDLYRAFLQNNRLSKKQQRWLHEHTATQTPSVD